MIEIFLFIYLLARVARIGYTGLSISMNLDGNIADKIKRYKWG